MILHTLCLTSSHVPVLDKQGGAGSAINS